MLASGTAASRRSAIVRVGAASAARRRGGRDALTRRRAPRTAAGSRSICAAHEPARDVRARARLDDAVEPRRAARSGSSRARRPGRAAPSAQPISSSVADDGHALDAAAGGAPDRRRRSRRRARPASRAARAAGSGRSARADDQRPPLARRGRRASASACATPRSQKRDAPISSEQSRTSITKIAAREAVPRRRSPR